MHEGCIQATCVDDKNPPCFANSALEIVHSPASTVKVKEVWVKVFAYLIANIKIAIVLRQYVEMCLWFILSPADLKTQLSWNDGSSYRGTHRRGFKDPWREILPRIFAMCLVRPCEAGTANP